MSLKHHTLSSKEFFNLMLDLKEFIALWRNARIGNASPNDLKALGEKLTSLSKKLGILPFRGRLLRLLLTRRPTLLPKWTGIPHAVDMVLNIVTEYLTYRYDQLILDEISNNPNIVQELIELNANRRNEANGFIFEVIVRWWLKEVKREHWRNVQNVLILTPPRMRTKGIDLNRINNGRLRHGIEIDAFSPIKADNQLNIAIAEIKRTLSDSALILEIVAKTIILAEHFKRYAKMDVYFVEIALIGGKQLSKKEKDELKETLRQELARYLPINSVNYSNQNVNVYDITDILNSIKNLKTSIPDVIRILDP